MSAYTVRDGGGAAQSLDLHDEEANMTNDDGFGRLPGASPNSVTQSERTWYLPEPVLFDDALFPADRAALIVAQCAAQFANRYKAWPVGNSMRARTGELPGPARERDQLIADLFQWVESYLERGSPASGVSIGLLLYRGRQRVLDQHDGIPAKLRLTTDEYQILRHCLAQHGLDADLYYSAGEERTLVEPVRRHGGVVLAKMRYSPGEWSRRRPPDDVEIPEEIVRVQRFVSACQQFSEETGLRIAEITEPGKEINQDELSELRFIRAYLDLIKLHAQRKDVRSLWPFIVGMFRLMERQRLEIGNGRSNG